MIKLVKCPCCGEEIEWLKNRVVEIKEFIFEVDANGTTWYDNEGDVIDTYEKYLCPKCAEVVAHSEEEAKIFLQGKTEVINISFGEPCRKVC